MNREELEMSHPAKVRDRHERNLVIRWICMGWLCPGSHATSNNEYASRRCGTAGRDSERIASRIAAKASRAQGCAAPVAGFRRLD